MTKEIQKTETGEDLIKALAWEVSRNVIDHHRFVYKEIFDNAPSTLPVSLRNSIYNQITSAIKCHTEEQIREWIALSDKHRRKMQKLKRTNNKLNNTPSRG